MGGNYSQHLVEFELTSAQEVTTALKLVALRNYADTPFFEKLLDGLSTFIDGNNDIPIIEQLEALGAADDLFDHVTAILVRYSSHTRLCGRAFTTIINICRYSDTYNDGNNKMTYCNYNIRGFGAAGACEAVVAALKSQITLTDDYGGDQGLMGCMVNMMPKQNVTCVDDAVKTVFTAHEKNADLLSIGCNAMICLSQENGENIVKLRNAGACEVLNALAQAHMDDRDVICSVFSTIEHISAVSPQFKLAIVAAGCCDIVVAGLNAHHEDKCAATLGLEMISSLTGGPGLGEHKSEHQNRLRKAGKKLFFFCIFFITLVIDYFLPITHLITSSYYQLLPKAPVRHLF